ncbi:MAG: hypothetical protein ACI9WS_003379, partial [Paraglaciecola psychrophila]
WVPLWVFSSTRSTFTVGQFIGSETREERSDTID